jgi:hypothetical protein
MVLPVKMMARNYEWLQRTAEWYRASVNFSTTKYSFNLGEDFSALAGEHYYWITAAELITAYVITYSRVYLFINCTQPHGVVWRSRNIPSCLLRSTECIYLLCANPPRYLPTQIPTYISLSLSLSPSFPPYLIIAQFFCITKKYLSELFLNRKWLHLLNLYHPLFKSRCSCQQPEILF